MSTVIVVTPIIIAHWPAITAAVMAAVGTMGFAVVNGAERDERERSSTTVRTEIDVEESEILTGVAAFGEQLVVVRGGVKAIFSRDPRGGLRVCMEGESVSKNELKRIGEELVGRVTQQYVYHRVVSELKERRMAIVDEQVDADRTVRIRVRNPGG
jgi:hypothetical protein